MNELKLVKISSREPLYYRKIYQYGEFKVIVQITEESREITCEDLLRCCSIVAFNDYPAILEFPLATVRNENLQEFLELFEQAKELLKLLDENREMLFIKEV